MSNESKTTKSYKLSPELKEKLERLASESGLETQEAFIEQLASLYELQKLKEGSGSGYIKQIEELEYHLRRNVELFVGMINTEAAERLEMSQQHEESLGNWQRAEHSYLTEIADLKREMQSRVDELGRAMKDAEASKKLADQLTTSVKDKEALVEEYRQRIDTLSGLVNNYKAAAEENNELSTRVTELASLSEKQAAAIDGLRAEKQAREEEHLRQIERLEERHKESLERLAERAAVEKERELLALRTEYQSKLEKEREEATAKIRELYEQRDQLRNEIAKLQQKQNSEGNVSE